MMRAAELDPLAILGALGVADVTAVEPVAGGWDTALWRVERAGGVYALRVFRAEQAETCRREVLAMRAAAAGGIPVPALHAEGTWHDRPALLLSWCRGRPLLQELRARPWRAWTQAVALGRMHARIHAVPPPPALRRWTSCWDEWLGPDDEPLQAPLRTLAQRSDALLHLDYHPLNVMSDGVRVTGVLDWANAAAGDPRLDLARTVTLLRLAPAPPDAPPLLTAALRRVLELGWRRGYRQLARPVGDMATFYAAAGTMMVRDLTPKIGRPGVWLEPHHLDRVRRWAAAWKRRAGVPL